MSQTDFTTQILHADRRRGAEGRALHQPIHHSVAFGYESAETLAAVFQGQASGHVYGRQSTPTLAALEHKITLMEQGVSTVSFATGMAAIAGTMVALLRAGDHVISSSFLFGNTNSVWGTLQQLGVTVSFVDATDCTAVAAAITPRTRLVFVETIANPRTQVTDLAGIGQLCAEHGLLYVVDNTMTSPYLFLPRSVGAHLSINAGSKYIGGHGNALGGMVTYLGGFDWTRYPNIYPNYQTGHPDTWGILQIRKKGLRDFGATLGADNAHHIAVGAETLALRMERACHNAQQVAELLAGHPAIARVYYPGLPQHPQHALARQLFRLPGALLAIELQPDRDTFAFLNRLKVLALSSSLGDTRSLAIPVAQTIYHEMGAERRASMGIADSLVRLSIGIEESADLLEDFSQALA